MLEKLDQDKQDRLLAYLDLVIEKNKELNLTRIDTREKGILLHLEDSLSCLEEFENKSGPFLDIGTGGGFPGVPLAIVTGRPGVLIDSIQKKAKAVKELSDQVGLSDQIKVFGCRSEDLAREHVGEFETVILRAVDSIPVALELATPLVAPHGEIILLKAKESSESIKESKGVARKLGLELVSQRSFKLGDEFDRCVLVYERVGDPKIKLPRRNGMAHKRPLTAS